MKKLFEILEDDDGYFGFRRHGIDVHILTDRRKFNQWTDEMMQDIKEVLTKISVDLAQEEQYVSTVDRYKRDYNK